MSNHKSIPYQSTDHTIEQMYLLIQGDRGEKSHQLRSQVENIVRYVRSKDKLSFIVAIYNWFCCRFTYANDPLQVELVKDPMCMLEEILEHKKCIGDCDDASTFLACAPRTLGIQTKLAKVGFKDVPLGRKEGPFSHVLAVAFDQYNRPIVLDPVAGKKTTEMMGRIKQVK